MDMKKVKRATAKRIIIRFLTALDKLSVTSDDMVDQYFVCEGDVLDCFVELGIVNKFGDSRSAFYEG